MRIPLSRCAVRDWRLADRGPVAALANNPKIAANLRDAFPSPYTVAHADEFLAIATAEAPTTRWAIEIDGAVAGGIGVMRLGDVERVSAEIGYWLGEPYWGRGVMTEVVRAVTDHAFATFALTRIYAVPLATNVASHRVLEKAGYALEGRMRRSAIKHGEVVDQLLYADVR
jgi:[ribosomal protein S5]-alanine N-acetyltransferase